MDLRPPAQHGPPRAAWRAPTAVRVLAGLAILVVIGACGPATSPAAPGASIRSSAVSAPAGGTAPSTRSGHSAAARRPVTPAPARTVIVIMENHSYGEVIGSSQAPFVNRLARHGALFTNSRAVTHPSQPNYLALFSGSAHGITDDSCPHQLAVANLGSELLAAGQTFAGYSEGLPGTGSAVCASGEYARKHVPWTNFGNVPSADSKPFSSFPAGRYARLPRVSFVIPNLCHDMHDCPVATGDAWLKANIGRYAAWAMTHRSLLILTWDENDGSPGNRIPTIFAGQMVRSGRYGERITHYSVLRTIENIYRLPLHGHAVTASLIRGIWR